MLRTGICHMANTACKETPSMIPLCRWAPPMSALPMLLSQSVDATHRPKRSMHSVHMCSHILPFMLY